MTDKKSDGDDKWSTTAKVGAAVGSAALSGRIIICRTAQPDAEKGQA